jgi:hypothetical protein
LPTQGSKTENVAWKAPLPGYSEATAVVWEDAVFVHEIFRASPTGADGKIYCLSEAGPAVVLEAGDELKTLATIPVGEAPVRASVAMARGQLFIRTAQNLYCIGKPRS